MRIKQVVCSGCFCKTFHRVPMVPIACAENVPVSSNRAQGMEYSYSVVQLFKSAVLSDSLSDCKYATMIHIEMGYT